MADGLTRQPIDERIAERGAITPPLALNRETHQAQAFLSTTIAERGDRRLAVAVLALSALGFAAAVPFAKLPLVPVPAFIPAYEAALILIDAITAVMLFGQYHGSRSPALLVLAAGYLYDALMIVPHLVSFPGAFAPAGLFGDRQTTAWVYMFWHGGFPLFVIAYALLPRASPIAAKAPRGGRVAAAIAMVAVLAVGLTLLAARANALLPPIMVGNVMGETAIYVFTSTWAVSVSAAMVLWRRREKSVLDLWLTVVMSAWVFDIALSAVLNAQRFDLGFYAGRAYGLLAASFVLAVLLVETGGLHSKLAAAKALVDDHAARLEDRVRERTAELEAETTARRKTEALLHQSQKMEALGQLTGGMAHDFNNHLGIIIGNLDLLGDQNALTADQKELVDEALAAAFNGAELTRRLLAFARRQPLRPVRIEVNRLIEDITKLLRRTLGEQIMIDLALDPTIPAITADPSQLETAIANLANNARDAMPRGGRLSITTGVRFLDEDYAADHNEVTPGGYVLIEVSDTGTGMPPEVLTRVFEPFFTTKEPGKGTGLGLSMIFGFIKQSGGHINVYSEPGHGTTFRLFLRPDETAAEVAVGPSPADEVVKGAGERILVVEDNARLRAVLLRQLHELGYRTVEAGDAAAARRLIDAGDAIDLLLTDVVLPGKVDGFALAREFIAAQPHGKVLLTSGFPGARLSDLDAPGVSLRLLDKPYRKLDLARTLREVLTESAPIAS